MLAQVEEFCRLLRKSGVRVSTAEVIDAVRAVDVIGPGDGARVRAALAACVVKRPGDRRAFDELFDLFFLRGAGALDPSPGAPLAEAMRAAGLSAAEVTALLDALRTGAVGMSPLARIGVGIAAPEVATLVRTAGLATDVERISSPLQIGYYTYRLLEELDLAAAEGELRQLIERLVASGALAADSAGGVAGLIRENFRGLRAAVRDWVQRQFQRQNLGFMEQIAVQSLADKPLGQLTEKEVADLRDEVVRLARALRAKISLRPETRRKGRLDLGRTLRRSLATGGVPFELSRRTRRRHRPRLLVLCDISDSVRNVSRFMLQFVYALQELFERVHSFAFVSDIGELTELFRRHDVDRAVELAYSGSVVNVFANSNYGRALRAFAARHLQKVTRRTTVLVIGDGRNNYNPAYASILGDIRRRAKQLWWLNPESPAAWGFGDSAMLDYQAHCDKVVVAHNLSTLKKVVDDLVV